MKGATMTGTKRETPDATGRTGRIHRKTERVLTGVELSIEPHSILLHVLVLPYASSPAAECVISDVHWPPIALRLSYIEALPVFSWCAMNWQKVCHPTMRFTLNSALPPHEVIV
jgi:hypothetical protein